MLTTCSNLFFPLPRCHHPSSLHYLPTPILHRNNTITTNHTKNLKSIHAPAKPFLLYFNLYLQLYVNAGLMREARLLFDEMPERSLISWTILMSGYTRRGYASLTLMMFQDMLQGHRNAALQPDSFVFGVVLRACTAANCLDYGRGVHCRILKTKGVVDSFIENALLTMYASCGSLDDAVRVFYGIKDPGLVSWSFMLSGYVQNGLEEEGLRLFCDMIRNGVWSDVFAFSMVIGACASLSCFDFGIQLHCYVIKMGFHSCLFLENNLVDFYARCGDVDAMRQVFSQMSCRDLVSWNMIIKGYVHNSCNDEALWAFRALMDEVSYCDDFTLTSILKAISCLGDLDHGREIHGYIIRAGFESNHYVISSLLNMYIECINNSSLDSTEEFPLKLFNHLGGESDEFITASILRWCSIKSDLQTGLAFHSRIIKLDVNYDPYVTSSQIDMYSKCGITGAAQSLFSRVKDPGTVPWSAIIAGHSWNGCFSEALRLFRKMQFDCIEANEYTYTSVLLACIALQDLRKGKEIHCKILRTGYWSNVSIVNTLVNLYSDLWHHKHALKLCSSISEADISWNFLIQACHRTEDHLTIHKLLQRIQLTRGNLDITSASYILSSCANPVLFNVGTQAQAYLTKRGLISTPITLNALINMYSGNGSIDDAITTFNQIPEKNSMLWTSIITANVEHGHPEEALELFTQMRRKNKSPDSNTFTSVLKACAQMSLVHEAFRLFIAMDEIYRIKPSSEHYSCIINVLGRAGMFEDALEFIDGFIPFNPGPPIWRTLLSTCRIHGNMKVAKYAAEKLLELEPSNFAANLLLEQVLLALGKWDDASKLKAKVKFMATNSSWIEIRNEIYEFVSDQIPTEEVAVKVVQIKEKMEELGYMTDRNHLLHNAEEEEYEVGLHTEIKALAFGLISLPHRIPIRVIKSVRMCGDCHSACKFMSTFIGRDLIIKDSCNFHNFKEGKCSCRDKW